MRLAKEFVTLSLGTVFLLLVLDHANQWERVLNGLGNLGVGFYGTLQGRNVAIPGGVQVYGGSH